MKIPRWSPGHSVRWGRRRSRYREIVRTGKRLTGYHAGEISAGDAGGVGDGERADFCATRAGHRIFEIAPKELWTSIEHRIVVSPSRGHLGNRRGRGTLQGDAGAGIELAGTPVGINIAGNAITLGHAIRGQTGGLRCEFAEGRLPKIGGGYSGGKALVA